MWEQIFNTNLFDTICLLFNIKVWGWWWWYWNNWIFWKLELVKNWQALPFPVCLLISGGGLWTSEATQQPRTVTADSWGVRSLSYHFLLRESSYRISLMLNAALTMKRCKRCVARHLSQPPRPKPSQWTWAQPRSRLLFSLTFHIFLSSRAKPLILSSTLTGGCSHVEGGEGWEGDEQLTSGRD